MYAKGGGVTSRREDYTKPNDTRFKKGDWKEHKNRDSLTGLSGSAQNTRTDDEADRPNRLGDFLGGGDRFTSQNFAEQGQPASMQRKKPDEDWSKEHVPAGKPEKSLRQGDNKSESPVKPRTGKNLRLEVDTKHGNVHRASNAPEQKGS